MKVELQAYTVPVVEGVEPQDFAAYVARIGKVKDNPEKLLRYLIRNKHWSPFMHTYISFKIETSRAIGRELLRHWSCTFQELSQRYEEVLQFEEVEIRKQSTKNRQSSTETFNPGLGVLLGGKEETAKQRIGWVLRQIEDAYSLLLKAGVARECARMILPECTKTILIMTGNLRSWIHFLSLRDDPAAQKEAQLIAKDIKNILLELFPVIFKAAEDEKNSIEKGKQTAEENKPKKNE